MNETASTKSEGFFLASALFLPMLVIGIWVILGPVFGSPEYITLTIADSTIFAFTCVGMTLAILGFLYIRKNDGSCVTVTLSVVGLVLNATTLFFASNALIQNRAEVKGTIYRIDDHAIAIYMDEAYEDEYNGKGSDPTLPHGSSFTPEPPGFTAMVSNSTVIYEKYGSWFWERRVVRIDNLEAGQHVQIKYVIWYYLEGSTNEAQAITILSE